ncbi:50S ribosomal protein L1 [Salmonella enterica subsp. houtenae serovar Houten]|nr:Putative exported protein [Salmonella enterica subsp. houtenae serovar 16:z4,z32:-- str. RKS3027]SQI72707.1 50S ribosomal protein L1 [Salmonella enterica subsp. houtenae serovar Houten]SUF51485.1 50S ribosomal protein L1 [Salmonella enterica]VEA91683.1 50S ribosomal protein L1 [Salmonella enterica subsp. houtenae]VUD23709.1 50S ribosomal protein L1 [Salmonella sp. NCTC 7297]
MHSRSQKMIKVILISIIGVLSLAAARYSPVTVVNAHPKVIARCLADNLYPYGYILDLQETDIPGVNKEFTVYCRNGAHIAGTFWIANSITTAPERTVGMYGVSKQAYPIFNKSLQHCATRLSVK